MRVTVGKVENLEEAVSALQVISDEVEQKCQFMLLSVQNKGQRVSEVNRKIADLYEEALCKKEVAYQQLMSAEGSLSSAYSALSVCEASGSYDENGCYEAPDCSSEKSDVDQAEDAVEQAKQALKEAEEHVQKMVLKQESACQLLKEVERLREEVQECCNAILVNVRSLVEEATARLRNAETALLEYCKIDPGYAEFCKWKEQEVDPSKPVTLEDLSQRLNLSSEQVYYYCEYLCERDPAFRAKIADYRKQYAEANGQAERHAVMLKIRKNLSGEVGERIVQQAFKPLGDLETQMKTTFENGKFTKTDLVVKNVKAPVILGRGKGMGCPVGGSIAIEVKCGRAPYLYSQKEHMTFQAEGHQEANASITICTRDVKDLSPDREEELRESLRSAGSPLIGGLPKKDEIDKACWNVVMNDNAYNEKEYGNKNSANT